MYAETIAGVTVGRAYRIHYALTEYAGKIVRAFGAPTKFLRDMQQHMDAVRFVGVIKDRCFVCLTLLLPSRTVFCHAPTRA